MNNESYLDIDKLNADINKFSTEAALVKDIFIITIKEKVFYVTNESLNVFRYITKDSDVSKWSNFKKIELVGFLESFIYPTNKYKTYNRMRIWKYSKTLELGNKTDLLEFNRICKNKLVQVYLREVKLKRILK